MHTHLSVCRYQIAPFLIAKSHVDYKQMLSKNLLLSSWNDVQCLL